MSDLPADANPLAFDTASASLFMTASQVEQYEAIGRAALAIAFKKHAAADVKKQVRQEHRRQPHLDIYTCVPYTIERRSRFLWRSPVTIARMNPRT